jgi:hypothetical protein
VTGTPVTSSANAAAGTQTTATATCGVGKVLLGGGARITATGQIQRVALATSYPSTTTTWTATGTVLTTLTGGNTFTVTAYGLCSQ